MIISGKATLNLTLTMSFIHNTYSHLAGNIWPLGVKRFCGVNSDQHFYVHIDKEDEKSERKVEVAVTTVRANKAYKFGNLALN